MSVRPLAALVVLTAGIVAAVVSAAPVGAATTPYSNYVALGDSWTADVFTTFPPTTTSVPIDCAQSASDYPHQVATALGVTTFHDASCGSATTLDMTRPQSLPLGGTNPPQFDRLSPATDLVTLGIGGNDVGLAAAVLGCLTVLPSTSLPRPLGGSCKATLTKGGVDQLVQAIVATRPKIVATLAGIRQRAPHARILLVNYLNGIPASGKGCWPVVPIGDVDVAYLQAKFVQMDAMLASAARSSGVQLVDTYTPTLGHDVCQAPKVRYIEGLIPISTANPLLLAFPFHPNQNGADAQARLVLAAINSPART